MVAAVVTRVPGEPGERGLPDLLRSLPLGLGDRLRSEPLCTLPPGLPPAVAAVVYAVFGDPGDPERPEPLPAGLADLPLSLWALSV